MTLVPGGLGRNYTGMLTRSIVFSGALFVFLAGTAESMISTVRRQLTSYPATGLTIASIIIPNWIAYEGTTVSRPIRLIEHTSDRSEPWNVDPL